MIVLHFNTFILSTVVFLLIFSAPGISTLTTMSKMVSHWCPLFPEDAQSLLDHALQYSALRQVVLNTSHASLE